MLSGLWDLLFPRVCLGCGQVLTHHEVVICLSCEVRLPRSGFEGVAPNPIEQVFGGRLPLEAGHSSFVFRGGSTLRRLLHQLKYHNHPEVGYYLGELLGRDLLSQEKFAGLDMVLAVPMHPAKEVLRGYNQAQLIAEGVGKSLGIPAPAGVLVKGRATESQTRKRRFERWKNVEGGFGLSDASAVSGKGVLLVDDVVTTGATLEACAQVLVQGSANRLCLATVACTW